MQQTKGLRVFRNIVLMATSLVLLLQGHVQPAQAASNKRACIIIVYDPWGSVYRTARNEGVTCHVEFELELKQSGYVNPRNQQKIGSQYVVKADRHAGRALCVITRKGNVYEGHEQVNKDSSSGGGTCAIYNGRAAYLLNYNDDPLLFYKVIIRVDRIAG